MSEPTTKEIMTCAETAKLLRQALKAAFPGIKFTVRSSTYAGGASIHVGYTDGPMQARVRQVLDLYSGASFDGMIDLKSYHDSLIAMPDGEIKLVHFGADFIFEDRSYSPEAYEAKARELFASYGHEYTGISINSRGPCLSREQDFVTSDNGGYHYMSHEIWRELQKVDLPGVAA